jgi:hypothetical protein
VLAGKSSGALRRIKKDGLGFKEEIEAFPPTRHQIGRRANQDSGSSPLYLWKQKQDRDWLERLDPTNATPEDVKRLERFSIGMRCLMSDMPGCFLL